MNNKFAVAVLGATLLMTALGAAAGTDCNCQKVAEESRPWNWNPSVFMGVAPTFSRYVAEYRVGLPNDGSFSAETADNHGLGYRALVGINFLTDLGAELSYVDYGEESFQAQSDGSGFIWMAGPLMNSVHPTALDLSFIGSVRVIEAASMFLRGGVTHWTESSAASGATQQQGSFSYARRNAGESPSIGAGVEYDGFGPWRLRAGYTRLLWELSHNGAPELYEYSLTVAYRFL